MLHWLEMAVEIRSDPPPFDLNEVVNQWYDWNWEELSDSELYCEPPYTPQEAAAVSAVRVAVDRFVAATPPTIVDGEAALALPEWQHLEAVAAHALQVMKVRGVLPE